MSPAANVRCSLPGPVATHTARLAEHEFLTVRPSTELPVDHVRVPRRVFLRQTAQAIPRRVLGVGQREVGQSQDGRRLQLPKAGLVQRCETTRKCSVLPKARGSISWTLRRTHVEVRPFVIGRG